MQQHHQFKPPTDLNDKLRPENLGLGHKPSLLRLSALSLIIISISQTVVALKPSDTPLDKRLQTAYSVDDIARQIRAQHQWRILAAEPKVEDEKTLYRFKLLNKKRGRVKVIVVDPFKPNLSPLQITAE